MDIENREYVEFQSGHRTFDLRGTAFSLADPYARITDLINPVFWIENDTDRRVFLFIDSVVISAEEG